MILALVTLGISPLFPIGPQIIITITFFQKYKGGIPLYLIKIQIILLVN